MTSSTREQRVSRTSGAAHSPSKGTARLIADRIRRGVKPVPVFAGETSKRPGDVVISTIGVAA